MIKPCGSPLSLVTVRYYSKFLALRQCGFALIAVFFGVAVVCCFLRLGLKTLNFDAELGPVLSLSSWSRIVADCLNLKPCLEPNCSWPLESENSNFLSHFLSPS